MNLLNFCLIVLSANIIVCRIWRQQALDRPGAALAACDRPSFLSKIRRKGGENPGNHNQVGDVQCRHFKRQNCQTLISWGIKRIVLKNRKLY